MMLNTVFPKQIDPLNFIQNASSFLFDSEKRNEAMLSSAISQSDKSLELLIELLENIDVDDIHKEDESIDESLELFKLLSTLLNALVNSLKKTTVEAEETGDPLFYKYRALYHKNNEVISTIDKIVNRIEDLRDNKLTAIASNFSISSGEDLWSDDEDKELRDLFLKS